MKKISMILSVCILMCAVVFSCHAEDADGRLKYSKALIQKIEACEKDETLNLSLWLNYPPLNDDSLKEDDFDDVQDYIEAKRAAARNYYLAENRSCFERLAEKVAVTENYLSAYSPSIFISASVSALEAIAKEESVSFIDVVDDIPQRSPTQQDGDGIYAAKFSRFIRLPQYDPDLHRDSYGTYSDYNELYYHYSAQGAAPDWALIHVHVDMYNLWDKIYCKQFGSRALVGWRSGADSYPYELMIYDAARDTFIGLEKNIASEENYPGLNDAIASLDLGYQMGDVNLSGDIEITDVTLIQRYDLDMKLPKNIYGEYVAVLGDVNGDGADIKDATLIQRYLLGLSAF